MEYGGRDWHNRTIIRISTDEGLVGIGETYGGDGTVRALEFAKPFVLEMDPLEVPSMVRKLQPFGSATKATYRPTLSAELKWPAGT